MAEHGRSPQSGRSTPNAPAGMDRPSSRTVGRRRAPRPVDADSESTIQLTAVQPESVSQTYTVGRRAKRPEPVVGTRRAARPVDGLVVNPAPQAPRSRMSEAPTRTAPVENTIVFPAVGELPEGRIPGARARRRAEAAASSTTGRLRLMAGAAALVVAAVGSITVTSPGLLAGADAALAQSYVDANATNAVDVSRSYDRELAIQQPLQAQQKQKALAEYNARINRRSEARADEITRNQWVIPVVGYRITARYGQGGGYWSSGRHTGLDFAGPSGSPIVSVAAGTVTDTGYEGAYGNRTIITLEDGTEVWYCHQSSVNVSVGQKVAPGDLIGATGSTGNVTGPHLHLEVHPPGSGPVDPYAMLVAHGVNP